MQAETGKRHPSGIVPEAEAAQAWKPVSRAMDQEAVRVVIGLDEALPSMQNFVLIGAPAHAGNEVMGSLAVIGPTRMDYQHTITAVSYIARLFDKILNESE